jgi:hypothetical protein
MHKKFRMPILISMLTFTLSLGSITASAATNEIFYNRGCSVDWVKDTVIWSYNGSKITDSSCTQSYGTVGLDTMSEEGVTIYKYGGTSHYTYTSKYLAGIGVPSPWGNVNVTSETITDIIDIYANGKYSGKNG